MKTINELVSEAASEYSDIAEYNAYESIIENIAFHKAATFATNLTFERLVEALKNERVISSYDYLDPSQWADWLVKNREKILNGGGNEHS